MEVAYIIFAPVVVLMGAFLIMQIILSGVGELLDWFVGYVTGMRPR